MKNLTDLVADYFLVPVEGKEKYALGIFDGFLIGSLANNLERGNTEMLWLSVGIYAFYHASFGVVRAIRDYSIKYTPPSIK